MALLALSEITCGQKGHIWRRKGTDCQKTPTRGHISWMLHRTRKDLKIYNLTTANAATMIHQNYIPPTPHYKMFNMAEDWGVIYQGVRECD